MRFSYILTTFLLMLLLSGCIKDISPNGMTVAIPASQITQSLQEQFPISQNTQYGKVVLKDPKALLQRGSDRITAGTTFLFSNALIPEQRGSLYISGKPYFDTSTGNIYLREPKIEKLSANGYNLSNYLGTSLQQLITPFINEAFQKIPIYKVNRDSIQGSFVKNVRVEDGSLLLTFGL